MILILKSNMFGNSDNWAIAVDRTNTKVQQLKQLFDIYNEVRSWLWCNLVNTYTELQWFIGRYEELTGLTDNYLNGKNFNLDNSALYYNYDFDKARESFNDDSKLETYLTNKIFTHHREVDELADLIPKMLDYLNQLKRLYHNPAELRKFKLSKQGKKVASWGDITSSTFGIIDNEPLTPIFNSEPMTTNIYHIADSLPLNNEEDEEYCDPYYFQ